MAGEQQDGKQAPRGRGRRAAAGEAEKPKKAPKPTEYVVLQLVHLAALTDISEAFHEKPVGPGYHGVQNGLWLPVFEEDGSGGYRVRVVTAREQELAIEQVTGKGEGALPGTWRAVALSSWKGATVVQPPLTVLQDVRETVE